MRRLGLDVGTNSIGWALLALDEDGKPDALLDAGVRIFADGYRSQDTTNAAERRGYRGARRRRDRMLQRRARLYEILDGLGLRPRRPR